MPNFILQRTDKSFSGEYLDGAHLEAQEISELKEYKSLAKLNAAMLTISTLPPMYLVASEESKLDVNIEGFRGAEQVDFFVENSFRGVALGLGLVVLSGVIDAVSVNRMASKELKSREES